LYFSFEKYILKALREAIFDEIVTKVEIIEGKERKHLLAFLNILENVENNFYLKLINKIFLVFARIFTNWLTMEGG